MSDIILPSNDIEIANPSGNLLPSQFNASFLGNLKPILEDVLAGDPKAATRPEFTCLNLNAVQKALDWLQNNDMLSKTAKADLIMNPWRLNYKDKPPTPEEFLTKKFIGPQAEGMYEHNRKAFIEFMDPLKPYDCLILYSCIGSGKDQPISSLVAVEASDVIHIDLGKKILHLISDESIYILYKGKKHNIKAKDLLNLDIDEVDLPQPVIKKFYTNLCMKVYDTDKINLFTEAKSIDNYTDLINYFKQFNHKDFYDKNNLHCHLHHIIPRSEGGTDDIDNLIYLPYRYHIKAHYLLGLEKEKINDKRNAMANFKAVIRSLNEPSVPKSIRELEQKLDYVLEAMSKKGFFEKQTFWVKKPGEKSIRIFKEELDAYLENGWIKGRNFKSPEGKVWVYKDQKNFYIAEDELDTYLSKGYTKGMYKTEKMKKANHTSYSTKNTKWMTSPDGIAKAIDTCEVDNKLKEGWTLGHKRWVFSKGQPHKKQGFHWYNNGKDNMLALQCPEGWTPGRLV